MVLYVKLPEKLISGVRQSQKIAKIGQKMHVARKTGKKECFLGCWAVDPPINLKI